MLREVNEMLYTVRMQLNMLESELELRDRRELVLALCMATHPRLGASADEGLSRLPTDIISLLM